MSDPRHVRARAADGVDRDFPARPVLDREGPCAAIAIMLGADAAIPDLSPLRRHVRALWRGPVAPGAAAQVVIALFDVPVAIPAGHWPTALALVAEDGFTLRSFARDDMPATGANPRGLQPRWVDLWWNGARHRVALDALDPLPIADLWPLPRLELHLPGQTATPLRAGARPADAATGRGEPITLDPDGSANGIPVPAIVSTTDIPFADRKANMLAAMAAALEREAGQRTGVRGMLDRLFGGARGQAGDDAGQQAQRPAPWGAPPRPRGPGPLAALAGWLRWHSPLAGQIANQYSQRLNEVEKLIRGGNIDAALKLALRVGALRPGAEIRRRFPNRLPPMRASLDFDLVSDGFSLPILQGSTFFSLHGRYLQLADQLERDGDHRRAAYIHSQLLGNHRRAVEVLEAGEMYLDAARLALDARLDPAIAIRMFFKAGELDTALALAKRTGSFERLAADSDGKDGTFHAYVVKAWTDMLLATGQVMRALQVTDRLATTLDADTALHATRRRWLVALLREAAGDGLGAELVVRVLLTARWTSEDLATRGLEDLPHAAAIQGAPLYTPVLDHLQRAMRGEVQGAAGTLLDLLAALCRLGAPGSPEQAAFWSGPAPLIVERFVRAIVEIASAKAGQDDYVMLRMLASQARLPVLAADIAKVRQVHAAPDSGNRVWTLPSPAGQRPAVRHACLMAGGFILAWRDGDTLELLDPSGAPLWHRPVGNVAGLVAIGTSRNALVIQDQRDGRRMVSRFAGATRTLSPIGAIDLLAWHDVTSESQWLAQIGGKVGALDLVRLSAASPDFTFTWSCSLTDRLRAVAFSHGDEQTRWLTRDISPDRQGLIEQWTLHGNGELSCSIVTPPHDPRDAASLMPGDWHWIASAITEAGTRRSMRIAAFSVEEERTALQFLATRRYAGIMGADHFQACDFTRPWIGAAPEGPDAGESDGGSDGDGAPAEMLVGSGKAGARIVPVRLRHDRATYLQRLARGRPELILGEVGGTGKRHGDHQVALLADAHGRMVLVDVERGRVDLR